MAEIVQVAEVKPVTEIKPNDLKQVVEIKQNEIKPDDAQVVAIKQDDKPQVVQIKQDEKRIVEIKQTEIKPKERSNTGFSSIRSGTPKVLGRVGCKVNRFFCRCLTFMPKALENAKDNMANFIQEYGPGN
ncbi:hypothetical protein TWF696_003800 [Orbilia brochopaga]|uniref:Uncharacterized protein n=1 Tax=Orbilia brochopaga TaxID=3140254 RepID=A0AAV9V524_9PEZI